MSTHARRRMMNDFRQLKSDPPPGIDAEPKPDNFMSWNCVLLGPRDTIFEDGIFRLSMEFTEEYPNSPPNLKFITKIFHPNIYDKPNRGAICLDILQKRWLPSYTITSLLTSLQSLLDTPNCASPANAEAANLYETNREAYIVKVKECVRDSMYLQQELTHMEKDLLKKYKGNVLEDLNVSDVEEQIFGKEDDSELENVIDGIKRSYAEKMRLAAVGEQQKGESDRYERRESGATAEREKKERDGRAQNEERENGGADLN
uniref:UBIQUITIN_CONJUGAT_2 domain-containing protein n=1 Tax=Rhabditophanes sp. KR3021 TaxID=114890 RepID=A0AC35TWL6_9BILA